MSLKFRQKSKVAGTAEEAAVRLLSRREHSRQELRAKLTERGLVPQAVDDALERLASQGLVSDERFTEGFIRHRIGQGHGPIRISADLRQRGVAESLVQIALEAAEADWEALAHDTRARRFGPESPGDYRERSKQMRFLQYRGFPTDIIRRVVNDSALEGRGFSREMMSDEDKT
ncbi:regulatory protein [Ectothiorhodospira magna]|uniref:Regulatory protein RecX n=1 Tax=Ectothiorhodospira magna TaxID=867345 RepID=A0A1H9ATQ2_9GAMM|nr:regulatory protein RecX [Ectothiorhodospira magna]SEP80164.1 regulatory protein [Ectothiorhodospira magna]